MKDLRRAFKISATPPNRAIPFFHFARERFVFFQIRKAWEPKNIIVFGDDLQMRVWNPNDLFVRNALALHQEPLARRKKPAVDVVLGSRASPTGSHYLTSTADTTKLKALRRSICA